MLLDMAAHGSQGCPRQAPSRSSGVNQQYHRRPPHCFIARGPPVPAAHSGRSATRSACNHTCQPSGRRSTIPSRQPDLLRCQAGSGTSQQERAEAEAVVKEMVEDAGHKISEMLNQIRLELGVATEFSNDTSAIDETEQQIISKVVANRLDSFDYGFVDILFNFAVSTRQQKNHDLADRLDAIRAEILSQVTDKMPPEVRVLNTVTQLMSRQDRRGIIREAARGGHGKLPAVKLAALWLATTQVLDDMEEKDFVPDRRLHAMVCIAREEVQYVAAELGEAGGEFAEAVAAHRKLLPPGSLAFLQRLLDVSDPVQRQGLLSQAFNEKQKDHGVKPGQLMTCVAAMHDELSQTDTSRAEPEKVFRLQAIQQEALQALTDIVERNLMIAT